MTSTVSWSSRARDWAANEDQQRPTYEAALSRVDGDSVIDVGCGSGAFLAAAAERGMRTAGLDASAELAAIARERVPGADVRVGDMQALPWEDDSFDVVTGFNSFFFAADLVAALGEAGRVAKPGAPVVIQVWGRAERCSLIPMKDSLVRFLDHGEGPPVPDLSSPGVLEGIAAQAELAPQEAFDVEWSYSYPDDAALLRAMLSPNLSIEAVAAAGEEAVRAALLEVFAPHRTADGGYRLPNEWHFLVARA
jgi:SAM-dependent methyltransferase